MTSWQPHCSKQAFARRGNENYETQLHPKVEADNYGGIVAINPACSH
jgi:GMP synthase-like glutamine amidotransferase